MTRRAKIVLVLFGVGVALVMVFIGLRLLSVHERVLPSKDCTPAPGNWLAMLRALVRDYRDPCTEFYWKPDPNGEFHVLVHLNNFGLHAPDYSLEKPPGVFRILVVGDSFPQGLQVETEQTFPYLLQRQLSSSGKKVEVINLSVDAYGTDRELLLYAALGWQFQPDLVLLSIYAGNDIHDNEIDLETLTYGYRLDRPFFTLDDSGGAIAATVLQLHNAYQLEASLYPDSPVFQWLASRLANQSPAPPEDLPTHPAVRIRAPNYALEYPVELGLYLPEDSYWSMAWKLTEALLLQFRDVVAIQGVPFAAIIIPDRRAVQGDDWSATLAAYGSVLPALREADVTAPNSRLEKFLLDSHIPALDLTWTLRAWAQGKPGERLYYAGDGHFTPNGHAVTAARIAAWLRGLKLIR